MTLRPIIIAALQAAGLYIIGSIVPLLGQFAVLFAPVPLITATVLHGRATGAAATGLAAGFVALLGSWQVAVVLFLLGFGLMALGLAEGMLRNLRSETVVVVGSVLPLAALMALLAPFLLQAGKDPLALIETYLRTAITDVQKLYTDAGATEVAQVIATLSDTLVHYLVRLLPGIILTTTVMQAAGCYGLARALVLRRRPDLPMASRPALPLWHAPDTWVWPLIAMLALIAVSSRGTALWFVGLNLSFLFLFVYTVQGVAVLEFYFRKARIPVVVRSIMHAVLLALPTVVAVIAVGVVDIWADFRKVRAAEPPMSDR
jgi:uncharacterized protein YybS (DUF2232 family)